MYKRLNDEAYTRLRKSLLKEKGSDLQCRFIEAAQSSDTFVAFMREDSEISVEGGEDLNLLDEKLTESDYQEPTTYTEKKMYELWGDIPQETACRVTFWGEVTLRHIENGCIEASYLAGDRQSHSGKDRIADALKGGGNAKKIDRCVLTILRRMSGLPEARGNISLYVNCPFACAWWRGLWSTEVSQTTGEQRDSILSFLRWKQECWETLVRFVVSRNSVLGDSRVRDALIWSLAQKKMMLDESGAIGSSALFESKTLRAICRSLGIRCAWQELGILDINELKPLVDGELARFFGKQ